MIQINLFKTPALKRHKARKRIPVKTFVIGGSICVLLAVLGIGAWALRELLNRQPPAPPVAATGQRPSAYSGQIGVEETVKDQFNHPTPINNNSGLLALPYEQLQANEKINYELLYAARVFEVLAQAVPGAPQVQFETLTLDSFETFKAQGIGQSAQIVRDMFGHFRTQPVTILPKPHTSISPAGSKFRFTITLGSDFGLNTADPRVDLTLSWIPPRSRLDMTVRSIEEHLRKSQVVLTRQLTREKGFKSGKYRRFVYRFDGQCSYNNLVRFCVLLVENRIPCAVQTLRVKAISASQVQVSAQLLLTFGD